MNRRQLFAGSLAIAFSPACGTPPSFLELVASTAQGVLNGIVGSARIMTNDPRADTPRFAIDVFVKNQRYMLIADELPNDAEVAARLRQVREACERFKAQLEVG